MAQDEVRDLLRKQNKPLTITEIAQRTGINYRTAARNLQGMGKWNELVVATKGDGRTGKKTYRLKE
jgi:predicted transcriptional regulator